MDKKLEEKIRKFDKVATEIVFNIGVSLVTTLIVILLVARAGWL